MKDKSEAEEITAACSNKTAIVRSVKRESKIINPPKLFDLTTMQREANRLYGFTAQQVMEYAQSLYESGFLTYPRTSSQFLTDDMEDSAGKIIKAIAEKILPGTGDYARCRRETCD
jgi:DNA topoisomerase-3